MQKEKARPRETPIKGFAPRHGGTWCGMLWSASPYSFTILVP